MSSHGAPPGFPVQRHRHEEDVTDDVPPGFGPGVARYEDDLPEFNFVNSSNPAANVTTTQAYKGRQHVPLTSARPVEQMRELVQKYGKRSSVQARPWDDDDDDDIPEWNPNQLVTQQQPTRQLPVPPTPQQPLPPPPPPPSLQQLHHPYQHQQQQQQQQLYHHQNALQPQIPSNSIPQAYLRTQQPLQQLPLMQQQLQPAQAWQQTNAWWPAQGGAAAAAPASMVQQSQYGVIPNSNNSAQSYGSGSVGGMAWRRR